MQGLSLSRRRAAALAVVACASPFVPAAYAQTSAQGPQAVIAVTFDDGLYSQAMHAIPYLTEKKVPATLYVPTSSKFDKDRAAVDGRWALMSWKRVQYLANAGMFEIGSHGDTHRPLTDLDPNEIRTELSRSADIIQNVTGRRPTSFAAPQGKFDERTDQFVKAYYRSQLGVWWEGLDISGVNTPADVVKNPYKISRLAVIRSMKAEDACGYINRGVERGAFVVVQFHNVVPDISMTEAYDENATSVETFKTVIDCIAQARESGKAQLYTVSSAIAALAKMPTAPAAPAQKADAQGGALLGPSPYRAELSQPH